MNASKKISKTVLRAATAAFLMLAVALNVSAANFPTMMEQFVTEDAVLLFVLHNGEELSVEARVGTEPADGVSLTADFPISTWLLIDNSLSITNGDREKTKQLVADLVAGRTDNEQFTLCTFDEHLNILLQDCQEYTDLKSKIDTIQYNNQETYLTDVLNELLEAEKGREDHAYVRVVVISDGVDNNPGGLTREELNKKLAANNMPIYTLGCERKGNEQQLKEMYSLSRQTGGQSWSLTTLEDILTVTKVMSNGELPIQASVTIPEKLRDGATKGIQLTFSDGAVVETQAVMPFGTASVEPTLDPIQEPNYDPAPEPELEPEPEPEDEPFPVKKIVIGVAGILVTIGVMIGIVLFLRRKRETERIKPVSGTPQSAGNDATDILDMGSGGGAGDTVVLVGADSRLMLSLTDSSNPNRYFESPLRDKVTIGRSPTNQIVLDYDKSVSGTHCEIFLDSNLFRIRDLNSRNGTYVDGIRVVGTSEIVNGSTIRMGRLSFVIGIR